eukprot:Protomagalhaensia_wolfi_Nauph_80__2137@NODE_2373_length_1111_cov_148_417910_g1859_i0_p3_GENE_NODE_2373_length_1111_cov_148_417910_g1859_i0NODE_2373_length_1111_cov_148_417910_g1859_i0_p3_ORF_typecomplete_len106_score21_85_NODE_2373_length_1111_cov_148_417910_g1859_i0615932
MSEPPMSPSPPVSELPATRVEVKRVEITGEATRDEFIYEGDEEEEFRQPDPYELKEAGNIEFQKGNYGVAIDIWKEGLKEALKQSCRNPSKALFDIQMSLRMNLA